MLTILYQDRDLVVCVKPAGLLSQDAGERSMPAMLRAQLGTEQISVIHRLDKDVGGVMVYALSAKGAAGLSRAVQAHTMEKRYQALLCGVPSEETGVLEDLLYHDQGRNKTYVVDRMRKGVKDARLDYAVLRQQDSHTLVNVRLHTGRTHQIRVQFASRRLPLAGDRKYGGKQTGVPLCLWSCSLSFPHPATGKLLSFAQDAPWLEEWDKWFT